jgi:hypothetical protein
VGELRHGQQTKYNWGIEVVTIASERKNPTTTKDWFRNFPNICNKQFLIAIDLKIQKELDGGHSRVVGRWTI